MANDKQRGTAELEEHAAFRADVTGLEDAAQALLDSANQNAPARNLFTVWRQDLEALRSALAKLRTGLSDE